MSTPAKSPVKDGPGVPTETLPPPVSPTRSGQASPLLKQVLTQRSREGRPGLAREDSEVSGRSPRLHRLSSFDLPHLDGLSLTVDHDRLSAIDLSQVPWWTSSRLGLAFLCFWGFAALYSQRVNLSIAIVSMVTYKSHNDTHDVSLNDTYNVSYVTPAPGNGVYGNGVYDNATVGPDGKPICPDVAKTFQKGEFNWSKELQGLILGAFFWGYLVLQVPGGWLAERYGAKKVVAIAMFPVAVLNILSPPAARLSPYLFIVVRILVGLGEAVMYPAAQALWAHWAPPTERSRLMGFSYAGGQFGNALIFPIGGVLCAYGFDGGWASVFYVIGGLGFIWCVFWVIFAYDRPADNPRISDIEREYIELSLSERKSDKKVTQKTPWGAFFKSKAVWAIIIAHMFGNYGIYMLLTQIPTYMKEVLKFDIKSNGMYSMLPYLNFWLFSIIGGLTADALITRNILSTTWTRKLTSTLGTVGPAIFLIATGFMECYQWPTAVALLTFAVGLCGFQFSGYFINHCDIAPPHAGTLFGITNTAATIPGILAPFIVAAITTNKTREEWQTAFYIAAGVYCTGALAYLLLASGEMQPWARTPDLEDQGPEDVEAALQVALHDIKEHEDEDKANGHQPNGTEVTFSP